MLKLTKEGINRGVELDGRCYGIEMWGTIQIASFLLTASKELHVRQTRLRLGMSVGLV